MDGETVVALDRDRAAQAVDCQALDEVVGGFGFAVEQQVVAVAQTMKSNRHLPCGSAGRPKPEAGRLTSW